MARNAPLTVVKGGIDRGRPKGGVRADVLYDLVNAYVTEEFKIKQRDGTVRIADLPAGTVGLTAFDGLFHVFASEDIDLTGFDEFQLNILLHPFDQTAELTEIHFAEPFLGALYVVAEFINPYNETSIYHYWLQPGETWAECTEYSANQFVTPTTPNGYVYSASRLTTPYPAWTAGAPRTAGNGSSIEPSIIEPTVYNEYYYTAIDTQGDNPTSGSTEPVWPTSSGETIVENTDGFAASSPNSGSPPTPPAANTPQESTTERYDR